MMHGINKFIAGASQACEFNHQLCNASNEFNDTKVLRWRIKQYWLIDVELMATKAQRIPYVLVRARSILINPGRQPAGTHTDRRSDKSVEE